jgi:hypothetical protein
MRTIVIALLALCGMACVGSAMAADAQTWADRQVLKNWTNAETRAQGEKDSGMSLDHAQKVVADWKTEIQDEKDSSVHSSRQDFGYDSQIAALGALEESLKGIMAGAERKNTQAVLDKEADDAAIEALGLAEKGLAKEHDKISEDIRTILKADRGCQLLGACSEDEKTRRGKIAKILDLYAENFKISCERADIVKIVFDTEWQVAFLGGKHGAKTETLSGPSESSDTALDRALTEILMGKCAKFVILLETFGSGQHVDLARCVQPVALDVTTRIFVTLDSVEKLDGQDTYWGSGKADHVVTKYTHAIHSCAKGDRMEPVSAKSSEPMEIRLRLLPSVWVGVVSAVTSSVNVSQPSCPLLALSGHSRHRNNLSVMQPQGRI